MRGFGSLKCPVPYPALRSGTHGGCLVAACPESSCVTGNFPALCPAMGQVLSLLPESHTQQTSVALATILECISAVAGPFLEASGQESAWEGLGDSGDGVGMCCCLVWCRGSYAAQCYWPSSVLGAAAGLWGSGLPVAQEVAPFLPPLSPVPSVGLSQALETLGDFCCIHFREGSSACVGSCPTVTNLGVDTEEVMVVQAWRPRLLGVWGSGGMAGSAKVYAPQGLGSGRGTGLSQGGLCRDRWRIRLPDGKWKLGEGGRLSLQKFLGCGFQTQVPTIWGSGLASEARLCAPGHGCACVQVDTCQPTPVHPFLLHPTALY